jgi:UDP:flavonoid glycosyltransferase YjiC (YdhE family)
MLADPRWVEDWCSPWSADDERPLVVVSFSSTYMAQERLLARAIDALGPLHARVLVTTGPAIDPASLRPQDNTVVLRSAPQAQVFEHAAVVVTHAGLGTVSRALSSGVPSSASRWGETSSTSRRVVYAGAGMRLWPSAKPAAIGAAVERLIREPRFRDAARRLGARMLEDSAARRGAARHGIAELEALASAGPKNG